ncbi:MAG: glycosyl hydrolase [Acidobacteriaceae bacterium]
MGVGESKEKIDLVKSEIDDESLAPPQPGISRRSFLIGSAVAGLAWSAVPAAMAGQQSEKSQPRDELENGFANPPDSAKVWAYWWWLNGYVTRQGIVKDLDAMKEQGIVGVLVFNAGGGPTPKSTVFMSQEWRDLFRFAVEEASKRNMEVSLNLCSGWNAGGPWITASEAPQEVVFSKVRITGPKLFSDVVPEPHHNDPYYRDIAVLAYKLETTPTPSAIAVVNEPISFLTHMKSYPDSYPSGTEKKTGATTPPHFCRSDSVVDLSKNMDPGGRLAWQSPDGEWVVLRFGHTAIQDYSQSHLKLCGPDDEGYEIDPLRADMMDKQFAATAGKVLEDVRPLAGMNKTLQYFHIDSWEIGKPNWTQEFRNEFKSRRGYDLFPYMAVLADESTDNPEVTARFLEDFNRTLGDLVVDNYYGRLAELSHQHGIGTHPESEGPELQWEDSLRALGTGDIMMAEYWGRVTEPDGYILFDSPSQRRWLDGIKGAAAAGHIYGKHIVQAEAFTDTTDVDWSEYPFALKDIGDRAFCAGLNRNVLCFYVHQPDPDAIPGYEWPRVGLKIDRNVTWFSMSHAWLRYLARCQFMFQRGRFVADVCYFYGGGVPNYVPGRESMDPPLPAGYDCDSINTEALLGRMTVQDGRLHLPGGLSYRLLVMPHRPWSMPVPRLDFISANVYPGPGNGLPVGLSAAVLRKIKELVENGATILGPKPVRAPGLNNYPHCDGEVAKLAAEIWGDSDTPMGERKIGKGRVVWGKTIENIFDQDGLPPDFTFRSHQPWTNLQYIHYSVDGAQCYFISNQSLRDEKVDCTFRVSGLQPELWDAVTGEIRNLPEFHSENGRTTMPMEFAPRQSFFVLFRRPAQSSLPSGNRSKHFSKIEVVREIEGPWEVSFNPRWGGPAKVTFEHLQDWTQRPEEGIRHYSGTARYSKTFDMPEKMKWDRLFLGLGIVNYVATVYLNGKDLGVVWTSPWRVEITGAVRSHGNILEIDVVNLWPNRLIGDAKLPEKDRFTKTNVRPDPGWQLFPSGLLGPIALQGQLI